MTANEMLHRFNLYFEGNKAFTRAFNEREISDFLTRAQRTVVLKKVAPWKNRAGLGIGSNFIRMDELAGLITGTKTLQRDWFIQGTPDNGALPGPSRVTGSGATNASVDLSTDDTIANAFTSSVLSYNYGVFVPIPDECVYILNEYCTVVPISAATSATATTYRPNVPIKRISHMEYQAGINDKYAKPYHNKVWSMDWGGYTVPATTKTLSVVTPGASDKTSGMIGTMPFSAISSSPIVCVPTNATNIFTKSTHGLVTNDRIVFTTTGTFPLGIDGYTVYYVIYDTDNTFQVSLTEDGSAVTFSTDGTGTLSYSPNDGAITTTMILSRAIYLIPGESYEVVDYHINYVKMPADITCDLLSPNDAIDSELADFMHDEIIIEATSIAAASIVPDQGKYQVNENETKDNE